MLNVYHSRLDESEIGRALDNTVSTLVNEEDSGWFADWMDLWKDISLSSSDSDDDKIFRPRKRERERESESETEFSDSAKRRMAL